MWEWISWIIIGIVYNIACCYAYCYINNNRFKCNLKCIIICFIVSLVNLIIIIFPNMRLGVILKFVWEVIMIKYMYNDSISKSLVSTFLIYMIFAIGEIIFVSLFIVLFNVDQNLFTNNFIGLLLSNIFILLISIIIIHIRLINKILNNIIKWYSNKNIFNDIIITALAMIIIEVLIYQNYCEMESIFSFIITNLFLVGIIIFIVGFFKEKTDNNKLTTKYDQMIDYVKTYEEIVEEKSKNQHEYKNQLIMIREMLGVRNKKIREYISDIIEEENKIEEYNWLNKLKNLPNGGLKGLIHYKISDMVKRKINVYVDINDNVDNKKIKKNLNDNLEDISKIIGVYIDNAIEAAEHGEKKYIVIEADNNMDELVFAISNTYEGNINYREIDNSGYSKKGKNRGFGLSLVKDIINKHKEITQYREFNGVYFVQKLNIKYKK